MAMGLIRIQWKETGKGINILSPDSKSITKAYPRHHDQNQNQNQAHAFDRTVV